MRNTILRQLVLGTLAGSVLSGCGQRPPDAAPAPIDTAAADTSVATPPITPPQTSTPVDTPPAGSQSAAGAKGPRLSQLEYDGWRQYSVHCARCHGQDALPNPVAADLLTSLGPGGPIDSPEKFSQVVGDGRPDRGMPGFKTVLSSAQIQATYAYVKGRAEKRIPPGRPTSPS